MRSTETSSPTTETFSWLGDATRQHRPKDRVQLHLVADDECFVDGVEPIDCPAGPPPFGGDSGQQGFVCFDADSATGRQLQRTIGSGAFTSEPLSVAFEPAFALTGTRSPDLGERTSWFPSHSLTHTDDA